MSKGIGEPETRTIDFPATAFSLEAIKRASYTLMAQLNVALGQEHDRTLCTLTSTMPGTDLDQLEQAFRREVLDQDLRLSLEEKTEPMRSAILGLAFSRTGLQHE